MSADGRPATVTGNGPAGRSGDFRLDVRELEIRSGRHGPPVVSEVSFAVRAGEVLGLVGESGSGKTTVALALLGYARRGLSVRGGEIRLDGVDLLRLGPGELRQMRGAKVSYVPQDPAAALNPALRIGYQLRGSPVPPRPGSSRSCARRTWTRLRTCCGGTRISCRVASSSASGWPWPLPAGPRSSCWTSPPPALTCPPNGTSLTLCGACAGATGLLPSTSATTWPWSANWRLRWPSCTPAASWRPAPRPSCSPSRCTRIPEGCSPRCPRRTAPGS